MLDQLIEDIRKEFPDFKLVKKSDSLLMKAINVFLLVISFGTLNQFMTGYTTTIGRTVYITGLWDTWTEPTKVILLRHERVHMRQAKRLTRPLFFFLYVFMFFPAGLAYFRAKFEKEAYEESITATVELYSAKVVQDPTYREKMIKHFTGSGYLFAWPFCSSLEKWFDAAVKKALNSRS